MVIKHKKGEKNILARKIISASVSGTIFAIILGLILPNPFGDISVNSIKDYFVSSVTIIPIYLMYSFPAILIYGVITSIISDKIGEMVSVKTQDINQELTVSLVMHIVFGLILFWFSLGASILFFITDRVIKRRNKRYKWLVALKSLAIPLITWLTLMGIVWANDMFLS